MKTNNLALAVVTLALSFSSCDTEESIERPSEEKVFPIVEETKYDAQLENMFARYNMRIEYRYIKNLLPNNWHHITPIKEDLIVPVSRFLIDYWVSPLELSSSKDFVVKTLPNKIVLVGSPAYKLDGTRALGQAEGGTLVRLTNCNDYDLNDHAWIRAALRTAYHEYSHILHQTFVLPDGYRKLTPEAYSDAGWSRKTRSDAIKLGIVSTYGTKNVSEDFAELFSFFITAKQNEVDYVFNDEPIPVELTEIKDVMERNEGRKIIRKKFVVLNMFLEKIGLDIENTREELQKNI